MTQRNLQGKGGDNAYSHSSSEFGIVVSKDVMVPMRDQIRLATDLYRPAHDGEGLPGPFPTILCRTPYDKSDKRYSEIADFFTPLGYAVALQDVRDRGRSQGRGEYCHVANPREGTDGYDTVEWLASRPWGNGRVGMVGSSYAALVQVRAAFQRPPHLTAIWPDVTPTHSYHNQMREGGAMQLHMFWALFLHAQDAQELRDDPEAQQSIWEGLRNLRSLLQSMPFKPGQTPLALVPNLEKALFDYYYRGAYDEYWSQESHNFECNFHRHADIPVTLTDGWYDPFASGMTRYYSAMAAKNSLPPRLVMGPWNHMAMRGDSSYTGDVDFGGESVWGVRRYFEEQLRFFDRWLKGISNRIEEEPPVRIFVMGGGSGRKTAEGKLDHGGCWRAEREWPLPQTQLSSYYLGSDGRLAPESPDESNASLSYHYDPDHPVPTIGGNPIGFMELPADSGDLDHTWSRFLSPVTRLRHIVPQGAQHQKEEEGMFGAAPPYPLLADRSDVLVFQTAPLERGIEATGPVEVKLWVSSSAVDTDFTAKLIDVYPPNQDYPEGYHMNLVDSIIRTRYRDSWEQEKLMEPGELYRVRIALPPTSNLFQPGHRIRLDISSSNFPQFDVNPNTGQPVGRHTHAVVARNTLHLGQSHPSRVVLPLIRG